MSITISAHTTPDTFANLREEWEALLATAHNPLFFQTPTFTQTWWETLGKPELQVLTFRDSTQHLVGLAPLCVVQEGNQRTLQFLGCTDVTDYQDILTTPEQQEEVTKAFFAHLETVAPNYSNIKLCSLPDASPTLEFVRTKLTPNLFTIEQQTVAPNLQLPETWEQYLESLDRKQRHEIRRKWRKLERTKPNHVFSVVTTPIEATQKIQDFIVLHKASSPGKQRFWDAHHTAFFTKLVQATAEAGILKLFFLLIDDQPVATMLIFDYNNQYLLYNSGYNPAVFAELSTGNTLLAYTIKDAVGNKRNKYDFLRGDEAYKFRFGATATPIWDLAR